MSSPRFDVVIIGGGFSGTNLAVQLLCRDPSLSVAIIEKANPPGRGLAYRTQARFHLLNVPAQSMSALPNEPDDFVRWAQHNYNPSIQPRSFLSRALFGTYVVSLLEQAIGIGDRNRFRWVQDEAISITERKRTLSVNRRMGPSLVAGAVVLALGNFPPANPRIPGLTAKSERYVPLAWSKNALAELPQAGTVLLLGSGLTSLDFVMALKSNGFTGKIHVVSRHGLLPQRYEKTEPWPEFWNAESPRTARGSLRLVRNQTRAAVAAGSDWRAVVDALRPATPDIWRSLPTVEQRRFLRHLRSYWEVHRHRIAPEIADVLADLIAVGQVRLCAGRVVGYSEKPGFAEVIIRERNTDQKRILHVDRMINCTGSENDCRRIDSPLLAALFSQGAARPDPLFLGLDVDEEGGLIDSSGAPSDVLYAIGPARKGCVWETTAVPEIRLQAAQLAAHLVRRFSRNQTSLAQHAATVA